MYHIPLSNTCMHVLQIWFRTFFFRGDKSKEEIVEKPDEVPTLKSLSKHLKKRMYVLYLLRSNCFCFMR